MKIFHIAYFGKFGKVTGIGEAVMNLVACQKELGNEVRIFIPFNHPFVDNESVFFIKSFSYLINEIKEFRPDIVIFNGMYDKYQIRLSTYLKLKSIPYVIVFHGGASTDNANRSKLKKKIANMLLFNRFVRWAERVIYLSENEMLKSVFSAQVSDFDIIPNGVKIPMNISFREQCGKLRILFISRLDWYGKGLDILCGALKMLYENGYESILEFSFYGPQESEKCKNLFAFGEMTKYRGYVTGKDKDIAFRNADVLILPSRSEGMPVVVLEAMSYGIPCIVSPETNMASLIENNLCGWVVNLSAFEIFQTIVKIEKTFQKESHMYFESCISTAKQFDWKEIAKKTIDIYRQVKENGKR